MKRFISLFTMLLLAACSAGPSHYLIDTEVLNKDPDFHRAQTVYALRDTTFPGYLDTQFITYRNAEGRLIVDSQKLWAQEFSENFRRVLSEMLSTRSGKRFYIFPIAGQVRPERFVDIQVLEMLADYQKDSVIFRSQWQVSDAGERTPSTHVFNRDYPLGKQDQNADGITQTYRQILIDLSAAILPTL